MLAIGCVLVLASALTVASFAQSGAGSQGNTQGVTQGKSGPGGIAASSTPTTTDLERRADRVVRRGASANAVYYNLKPSSMLYRSADGTKPYMTLAFHERVTLLRDDGAWAYVETTDGGRGYVNATSISNVWIRVSKSKKTVYVYEGAELIHEIPADLAYNFYSDKVRQGSTSDPDHWRTPEGKFFVVSRNPASSFYKAFVLNYPSVKHAERGLASGLISKSQYDAIVRAEERVLPPPMNTALGGLIEIHGGGTGARTSWTQGCVAIPNGIMDVLWEFVQVGTPVVVEA